MNKILKDYIKGYINLSPGYQFFIILVVSLIALPFDGVVRIILGLIVFVSGVLMFYRLIKEIFFS